MSLEIPWHRDIAVSLHSIPCSVNSYMLKVSLSIKPCVCVSVISRMVHIQYVEVIITDPA